MKARLSIRDVSRLCHDIVSGWSGVLPDTTNDTVAQQMPVWWAENGDVHRSWALVAVDVELFWLCGVSETELLTEK